MDCTSELTCTRASHHARRAAPARQRPGHWRKAGGGAPRGAGAGEQSWVVFSQTPIRTRMRTHPPATLLCCARPTTSKHAGQRCSSYLPVGSRRYDEGTGPWPCQTSGSSLSSGSSTTALFHAIGEVALGSDLRRGRRVSRATPLPARLLVVRRAGRYAAFRAARRPPSESLSRAGAARKTRSSADRADHPPVWRAAKPERGPRPR